MSFTSCPIDRSRLAQWCDPPHASIAISVGGSFSKNLSISLRRSFLRRTGSSAAFTPCNWKTCFDVSMPIRAICSTDGLPRLRSSTTSIWHIDAAGGRPPQQDNRCPRRPNRRNRILRTPRKAPLICGSQDSSRTTIQSIARLHAEHRANATECSLTVSSTKTILSGSSAG